MLVWYASFPGVRFIVDIVSNPFQSSTSGLPVLGLFELRTLGPFVLRALLREPELATADTKVSHVSRV